MQAPSKTSPEVIRKNNFPHLHFKFLILHWTKLSKSLKNILISFFFSPCTSGASLTAKTKVIFPSKFMASWTRELQMRLLLWRQQFSPQTRGCDICKFFFSVCVWGFFANCTKSIYICGAEKNSIIVWIVWPPGFCMEQPLNLHRWSKMVP